MQMSHSLRVQQTQKLVMTQELRQAITILQLSVLELEEYVDGQLLENPVLEIKEDEQRETEKTSQEETKIQIDWQEYFRDGTDWNEGTQMRERDKQAGFENFVTFSTSLHDHLLMQLHVSVTTPEEVCIGEHLIGNIDENGYLHGTVEEIAEHFHINTGKVDDVLRLLQSFDPPGVGARNLAECLLLQMSIKAVEYPLARNIIQHYLQKVGDTTPQKLAKQLGSTPLDVQEAIDFIKTLDPKPGSGFGGEQGISYVLPDVIIEKVEDEYVVLINDTSVPRLSLNAHYRMLARAGMLDTDTKNYIDSKMHDAVWLIKSIEQRRQTLLKVVGCIAEIQRGFLDYGVRHLKPLVLRQIAERIGMHESTVSRATHNKYVQTPRGLFPLRFFFSSGVEQSNGEGESAESIKQQIKQLVQDEDSDKPLSDQAITEMLFASQSIRISRRTVAKYREEIGIPSSNKRKRY